MVGRLHRYRTFGGRVHLHSRPVDEDRPFGWLWISAISYSRISYLRNTVPGSDKKQKVILYYFWVCAFMTILWYAGLSFSQPCTQYFLVFRWSRLSLGFSIARIFPPALKPRKYAFMIIFGIFLTWIALVTAEVTLCARNTSWHNTPTELLDCRDNYPIGIALASSEFPFISLTTASVRRLSAFDSWHSFQHPSHHFSNLSPLAY